MTKPLILVTNDDGSQAKGLRTLVQAASKFGDVVVVAPDSPQSGQGHAITLKHPLRLRKIDHFENIEAYECSGTPVDCVKLAKHIVLKDRVPDLCVSGINHGFNSSINILYSGTMSAAMEASIENIPSIGFSVGEFREDHSFAEYCPWIEDIILYVLKKGMKDTKLLNVNIPYIPAKDIKGIRVCRQAKGTWVEEFLKAKDPYGETYYWMAGDFVNQDEHKSETDIGVIEDGYIAVVPCMHDLTAHPALANLKALENFNIHV